MTDPYPYSDPTNDHLPQEDPAYPSTSFLALGPGVKTLVNREEAIHLVRTIRGITIMGIPYSTNVKRSLWERLGSKFKQTHIVQYHASYHEDGVLYLIPSDFEAIMKGSRP